MQQNYQKKIEESLTVQSSRAHAEECETRQTQIVEKHYSNALLLPEIRILEEGHTVTISLKGYSMRPFLENNRDKALLKKAENPQVGAPVLAEIKPHVYVLHRIVSIRGNQVVLRGDGNLECEHCQLSDVKGEVVGFYRKGRDTLDAVNGFKWKAYSFVWVRLYPIRRWLLAFYRRIWIPIFGTV